MQSVALSNGQVARKLSGAHSSRCANTNVTKPEILAVIRVRNLFVTSSPQLNPWTPFLTPCYQFKSRSLVNYAVKEKKKTSQQQGPPMHIKISGRDFTETRDVCIATKYLSPNTYWLLSWFEHMPTIPWYFSLQFNLILLPLSVAGLNDCFLMNSVGKGENCDSQWGQPFKQMIQANITSKKVSCTASTL